MADPHTLAIREARALQKEYAAQYNPISLTQAKDILKDQRQEQAREDMIKAAFDRAEPSAAGPGPKLETNTQTVIGGRGVTAVTAGGITSIQAKGTASGGGGGGSGERGADDGGGGGADEELPEGEKGDILYHNGTEWVTLAKPKASGKSYLSNDNIGFLEWVEETFTCP